jgi:hypothetical protein
MRTYRWGSENRESWIDEVVGRRTKESADGRSQSRREKQEERNHLVYKCCSLAVRVRVFPKSAEETELGARRIQGKMNGPDTDMAGYMAQEI